ncbi:MAG: imelysin family protein [Hyphomicrobiaceae bacterium]
MLVTRPNACLALLVASITFGTGRSVSAREPFDHTGLARTALERHIRPGYQRFERAASTMRAAIGKACPPRVAGHRKTLDAAFGNLVHAWGRIEHIQFGPVVRDNRLERILFWPDRRGLGARQIAKVLADRDPRVLDPAVLAGRSIALQGIGALEAVLYGDPTAFARPLEAAHRCGYAKSIASNLDRIARELVAAWGADGAFAARWLNPGQHNPEFLKPSETTLALAKAYDQGLERVRDLRLAGPLALNAERRTLPVILAASDRAMTLVTANIEGLRELYTSGGIQQAIIAANVEDADVSVSANARLIAGELRTALDEARRLLHHRQPFARPDARQQMLAMGFPLKNARVQAAALLTLTAGLTLGFNSSDGD